jgi:predicted transport protein
MTSLTKKEISNLAEELRIRHYEKYMGFKPHTRFSELEGTRLEKWLDMVVWAEELLGCGKFMSDEQRDSIS